MTYARRLPPTRRQAQLLSFLREYIAKHGEAPLQREMCEALNVRSRNTIREMLVGLQQRGQIQLTPGLIRHVALVDDVVPPVVTLQSGCKS